MCCFFLQAEDGIRDLVRSRGLGDVYKRQVVKGRSGSQGEATGRVRIVNDPQDTDFSEGEVLVLSLIHI